MKIPRISPAMAVALLALMMSTTGTAFAASKYLLTSTKQVSPKVLKALKGRTGPAGTAGAAGAAGIAGATGPVGARGLQGVPGAPGATGAPGAALGYGFVSRGGSISDQKGGFAISHPSPGLYCLTGGGDIDVKNLSVTIGTDGDASTAAGETGTTDGCPATAQGFVFTSLVKDDASFTATDNDFYFLVN